MYPCNSSNVNNNNNNEITTTILDFAKVRAILEGYMTSRYNAGIPLTKNEINRLPNFIKHALLCNARYYIYNIYYV